ncbi:radical SAM protein [Frankia sp. CNm7]|uniref:Ribosomal protein uS12 methylthiotransferase RimO n=1 Tax=Frankia nepalensis TaxID=1836974 RepID=A0A937UQU1_9ACTN|nr:radical SAM protein [Frankia nepalensis]MBL7501320.1 radical SAM protein [Frankia nepalensis]MBL7510830.1 radical SAM protein [Frankia nepalensis]MBL7521574.1 radical SAM protein [Frankia nepalensis]MBL7628605.1 radical SAM protein [Frankia nepalensis]
MSAGQTRRVALVTLGCSRNEVDSEELAARLAAGGWQVVDDATTADAVVVNTCGFVDVAKKDSIDALLAADGLRAAPGAQTSRTGDGVAPVGDPAGSPGAGPRAVVAVGCLAERYGAELAESLPEADAVLGFDAYPDIAAKLRAVLDGERPAAHTPRDRRSLLPITPVDRGRAAVAGVVVPGHGTLASETARAVAAPVVRRRLDDGPVAALKISSGCDRRCAFCAIPSFRGSHVSRPPEDILAEAEWLAGQGARELVLVSENSTSYGKDLGDLRALEKLLPQLAATAGIVRVRPVYLQPAELRPSLLEVLLTTPGVAPYLDLSFQHASPTVLRRMRRFGGSVDFLDLLRRGRALAPALGARSNVIVGFPGETAADFDILTAFLEEADLDAVGVFGYSDEEGTEAVGLPGKLDPDEIEDRRAQVADLVEQLTAARAERRVGETVEVLVEEISDGGHAYGCAAHQQPETDGACAVRLPGAPGGPGGADGPPVAVGDLVAARVIGAEGVDLVADFVSVLDRARVPGTPPGVREGTAMPGRDVPLAGARA